MLNHLIIKNFAIIEDIEISFEKGMNAIMGETGAGKSIIIDALSLLEGEKSSFNKIRNGQEKAFIEGEFYIEDKDYCKKINDEYGELISEDQIIIVSRTLDINGKSYARLNYHSVPLNVLKKIMGHIIDIHSQHKDNSYFDSKEQIKYLDAYIRKIDEEYFNNLKIYQDLYHSYLSEVKTLEEMKNNHASFEDLDYLTYQYEELEKANIQENELEDIEDELKSLESFQELATYIQEFDSQYDEASGLLYNSKKILSNIKDDKFASLKEDFLDLYYKLDEVHEEIMSKFSNLESSLDHLEYLRSRRSTLLQLKRKYGKTTQDILDKFQEIKNQIDLITNFDFLINEQEKKIASIKEKAIEKARIIHLEREKFIPILEKEVNEQLRDLLLENADFKISLEETTLNKFGFNQIIFKLRANLGGKYLPLDQTASLGETSRLHLAIKNVFNKLSPVGTIIFDEIDTGISGRVAIATSMKIKQISQISQTIVISHLPQMAAISSHHYFVSKLVDNDVTKTQVYKLNGDQVVEKISSMITGENESNESKKLAKNLIKQMNS
ncbi:MAG: DNA repair protein RecN [Bacillales bacterium]|nr:DNA repair protein RecN [Bacillales bacterium]